MEKAVQVNVEIGGRERPMRFDFNAYCAYEEQCGGHFLDLFNNIAGAVRVGNIPKASDISRMVWAGLYAVDETVTLHEVRSWMNLQNMNPIVAKLMEPFGVAPRPANDLAPFVPTPPAVVDVAIRELDLQDGDVVLDLGAGDGRVIDAAIATGKHIKAVGVEMNPERYSALVAKFSDNARVQIRNTDINELDDAFLNSANKVFVYLLTDSNERIRPLLERAIKPGSRVVSHHFQFHGWPLHATETIEVAGSKMSPHPIYTYLR